MQRRNTILSLVLTAIILIAVSMFVRSSIGKNHVPPGLDEEKPVATHRSVQMNRLVYKNTYDSSQEFMEGIYRADKKIDPPSSVNIRALIIPHHLTASESIASGIKMLQHQSFKKIVLISPDHFHKCPTTLCTVDATYQTFFGDVSASPDKVAILLASPISTSAPKLFVEEHGIFADLPFIAHYFPGVPVTPIALNTTSWKVDKEAVKTLIESVVDKDTMLIVSSDFSHYLSLEKANEMDEKTAKAIFSKDLNGISNLDNSDQSDCPGCDWVLASIANDRGFYNPSIVLHTNSATILNDPKIPSTTSHFAMVWYENAKLSGDDLAVGGDVTLTRTKKTPFIPQAVRDWWSGKGFRLLNLEGPLAKTCLPQSNIWIFCNKESLWLSIKDLAQLWSVENNHMYDLGDSGFLETKSLLKQNRKAPIDSVWTEGEPGSFWAVTELLNPVGAEHHGEIFANEAAVLKTLRESQTDSLKVVYIHGGTEYQAIASDLDEKRWRQFIDAGADVVIVTHAHVPSDMELYKGKLIFHGIGNFLFDQFDQVSTNTTKLVRLRKVNSQILFETLISSMRRP